MNTKGKASIKESKTKMTATTLMRLAGLSAMAAGLCFIVVGMFHPLNVPASVTTATWANVHIFAVGLGFFGLFGMAGLYARQVEQTGWLGLIGFALFCPWLALTLCFSFVEAFILPRLVSESPAFVEGFLGMFTGVASKIDLGILPTFWNVSGLMYFFGPLLFGIATFRARVLPRWAGALLVLGAVLVPVGALIPPEFQSRIMVPVGLALAWMGWTLFSERREKTAQAYLDQRAASPESGRVA